MTFEVYYRDSHGAIVIYDCKRHETLTGAFRWKKDLDSKLALDNGQPIPAVLVANKVAISMMRLNPNINISSLISPQCDLDYSTSDNELADYAKQGGFRATFKVSAKTGLGVDTTLDCLIRNIVSAERDGLYMMPIFHRDPQARQLSYEDRDGYGKGKAKSFFKNPCC